MACEKCWADAYLRSMVQPGKTQAEHYRDLLEERKENPCPVMAPCSDCGQLSAILVMGRCVECADEWAKFAEERVEALSTALRETQAALERDRTAVAIHVTAIKKALQSREWLQEGRGPYSWNDDNWHKEFAVACREISEALKPLAKIAADWSNCPMTAEDVAAARKALEENHAK